MSRIESYTILTQVGDRTSGLGFIDVIFFEARLSDPAMESITVYCFSIHLQLYSVAV